MKSKHSMLPSVTDYSDWFSPILVKELRQGLRSRIFLLLFCLLQAMLLLVLLAGIGQASAGRDLDGNRALFWFLVVAPIGLITPLQAIAAFSQEKENQNLEAILLTRMKPRQILFGKWCALFAIALLMGISALPYAVTRYFLGNVDVLSEVAALGFLLTGAAVFSMAGLVLSLMCSRVMRFLVTAGAVAGLFFFWGGTIVNPRGIFGSGPPGWLDALLLAITALVMFLILLENGAARVGSSIENYATRQRLLMLGAAVLLFLYGVFEGQLELGEVLIALLGVFLLLVSCVIPVEPIVHSTGVYRPFVKRGVLGKFMGRLLYPGWPSGIFFVVLLLTITFAGVFLATEDRTRFETLEAFHLWLALIGVVLFPAAIYHLLKRKLSLPGEAIILPIHAIQLVMTILLAAFQRGSDFASGIVRLVTGFMPTTQLIMTIDGDWAADHPEAVICLLIVNLFSAFVLILAAIQAFKTEIIPLEQQSAAPIEPGPSSDHATP